MSADPDREIARRLRLRGPRPPVVRLSRRALALLAGLATAAVAGAALLAVRLDPPARAPDGSASAPERPPPLAEVIGLPKDYAAPPDDPPKLGPPLFGGLGASQDPPHAASAPGSAGTRTGPDADGAGAQARASPLFAEARARRADAAEPQTAASGGGASLPVAAAPAVPTAAQGDRATPALVLSAGATIPAALVTALRSDLPGPVVAQVSEPVFDSLTGRTLLIPAGSRLIGRYASAGFGQSRLQVAWARLVLPDGREVALGDAPGADAQGAVGFAGRVDRHWGRLAGAALISSLLGVGAELSTDEPEDEVLRALGASAGGAANDAGRQLVGRTLDVAPTIRLPAGARVRVLVVRDLRLAAWPRDPGAPAGA